MNRRNLLNTTALALPALALAACASTGAGTSASPTVVQMIAYAQGVLSFTSPIVPLLAAFVPGALAFAPLVESGLAAATGILGTLSSTMTATQGQPIVGQFATAITGALKAAGQAIAVIPNADQRTKAQAVLASAQGVLAVLVNYATNLATIPAPTVGAALAPGVVSLHIAMVR